MIRNGKLVPQCITKHKGKFLYHKINPNGRATLVSEIYCKIHGWFEYPLKSHLSTKFGCPECAREEITRRNSKCRQHYLDIICENDLGGVITHVPDNINWSTKITAVCSIHGEYFTTLTSLVSGSRCRKCGSSRAAKKQRMTVSDRIKVFNDVHRSMYDYSLVKEIKSNKVKIPIICPVHGIFHQRVNDHQSGKGCIECSKSNCNIGYLMLIKRGEEPIAIKYGVTKNINTRLKHLNQVNKPRFIMLNTWYFKDAKTCLEAENKIKSLTKPVLTREDLKEGFTETTSFDNLDLVYSVYDEFSERY